MSGDLQRSIRCVLTNGVENDKTTRVTAEGSDSS